jgi:hypothetical protein
VQLYRLFQNNTAFEPDEVRRLEEAYAIALASLGLIDRSDPLTAIVAQAIITTAQTGETDPDLICAYALKSLGIPPPIDVP